MITERYRKRSCYEFMCMKFPSCVHAVTCCALDPSLLEAAIQKEECFDLESKPLYEEKAPRKRYGL